MGLRRLVPLEADTAEQLAGFTGLGWTTSILGYLGTVLGYGNGLVTRLVAEPQALLYLGLVLLATTLGLDRLVDTDSET